MKRENENTLTEFLKNRYVKHRFEDNTIVLDKGYFYKPQSNENIFGPHVTVDNETYYFIEDPPRYELLLTELPVGPGAYVVDAGTVCSKKFSRTVTEVIGNRVLIWNYHETSAELTGYFIKVSGKLSTTIEKLLRTTLHFELKDSFVLCCVSNTELKAFKPELADNIEFMHRIKLPTYKLVGYRPLSDIKDLLLPTVKEFLDKTQVDYIPINLEIEGKQKRLVPFTHVTYTASQSFLYDKVGENLRRYKECRKLIHCYAHLGHATDKVYVIDIDCKDISDEVKGWLKRYPYYKSCTKEYGYHILVKSDFKPNKRKYDFDQRYGSKIELLCGLWSFATKNEAVYNPDASMDMHITKDMLVQTEVTMADHVPTKPHDYGKIQKQIVDYLQKQPVLLDHNIEFLGFCNYNELKQIWQLRIRSCIEGFCPCKNAPANNNHNASICIDPKRFWMRCFRNEVGSDCQTNALIWDLPLEESKVFFPHVHSEFFELYGIFPDDEMKYSPGWLAKRFLYSNKGFVIHQKTLYERDAYGIVQRCSRDLLAVVLDHFQLLKNICDINVIKYGKQPKDSQFLGSNKVIMRLNGDMTMVLNHVKAGITDNMFLDKLDTNYHLIAFNNGVLDIDNIESGVRVALKDEYIMNKCRYDFEMASNEEIESFKRKIRPLFCSDEEMDFRLTYAAKCLICSNREEMILFELGRSDVLRYVEEVVFGDTMASISPDAFLARKTEARKEKCIDLHTARTARLWVCNHLELNRYNTLDRTQLNNFILRLTSRKRLNHENQMVKIRAPPIMISLLGSPCLPYLPGLHVIKYNSVENVSVLKDDLAAKPEVYVSMLLQYLREYMQHGLRVPASIRELSSRSIMENFNSWVDYYFEKAEAHIHKNSLHEMYKDTVGNIEPLKFTSLLRGCAFKIGRGLFGKKLIKQDQNWFDTFSSEKKTVVKNLKLKLNY